MQNENQTTQYDPQAVAMVRALKMQESGNDYNAPKETAGTSLGGAYQYQAPTWKAYAGEVLGDPNASFTPENQDKVTYGMVKKWKDNGMQPAEIAHMWNPGDPSYPDKVVNHLKTIVQGQSQPKENGYVQAPPITSQIQTSNNNPTTDNSNNQPESFGGKVLDVAKGVGNFLFPIVGDVYHDIKGDSSKTFLQQAGDLGLSALPFIPGLGEAGLAAKGAEAGVEGAGLLGKLAARSAIEKGALTGYGAGVASSLSQGKGVGESLLPNASNIGGAVLGGITPKVIEGFQGLTQKMSGIDPQIQNALKSGGISTDEYNKYINAAKERATNVRAQTPLTIAADQLDTAASKISKAREAAGVAVGEAKKAVGNQTLGDIAPVIQKFNDDVESKYGLSLVTDKKGNINALKIPGRAVDVAPGDQARIIEVAKKLNSLQGAPLSVASDQASNISKLIDYSKKDLYGNSNDPLEGLLKATDGGVRGVINETSPEMAQANANFSGLKNLESEISGMAGKNLNRGELLMKRVFSGDKSGDVQDLFAKIKAITGIDLVNHAVLAKHAIETVGDSSQKSLLQQAIEGGAKNPTGMIANLLKGTARKTLANPEKIGQRLVSGKGGGLIQSLLTKGAIEAGTRLPATK